MYIIVKNFNFKKQNILIKGSKIQRTQNVVTDNQFKFLSQLTAGQTLSMHF